MGLYRARGYTEMDIDLGRLILRIGGPRLLHTLRQVYGLPSASFLYKQKVATFNGCTGSFSTEVLKAHIDNMIVPRTECSLWVLMWDDVATHL